MSGIPGFNLKLVVNIKEKSATSYQITPSLQLYLSSLWPFSPFPSGGQDVFCGGQVILGGGQIVLGGGQAILGGGQIVFCGGQDVFGGGQDVFGGGQIVLGGGQVIFQVKDGVNEDFSRKKNIDRAIFY